MTKVKLLFTCLSLALSTSLFAQESDSIIIRKIFSLALENGKSYSNLENLCKTVGHRLSGSPQAEKAVAWAHKTLRDMKADTAYYQEVIVPHWERGEKESARIVSANKESVTVNVLALGGSIATPTEGIRGKVIEVTSFDTLKILGRKNIEGKIVFFNRPMDPKEIKCFHAYGKTVDQRWAGPAEAAKYGAIASVCRSVTHSLDEFPHTGSMRYLDSVPKIPCCAISTKGANLLSSQLKSDRDVEFYFKQNCKEYPDAKSYNVIGEIKGSEHPEKIIVAGGHLDSWDVGDGAQDDGAGIVHTFEVIRIFKELGIKPKNTIRIVAFMNEENGLRGGKKYADVVKANNEHHIAAIESDGGSSAPRGFSMSGTDAQRDKLKSWKYLLEPYGLYDFIESGGGADIGPLREQGVPLFGLQPDPQRYFDVHHTNNDIFENVHKRELELGSASIAALIYLIDKYGL